MIKAILLLAGNGRRFQHHLPKQYHLLCDKPVYLHTLQPFLEIDHFAEILLVCENKWCEKVASEVGICPRVRVIPGGKTRQESSYLGLCAAGPLTKYVIIHDGVRPFISKEILLTHIEKVHTYKAVNTCISSPDTIVHAKESYLIEIPPRGEYLRGQTPQSFSYSLIFQAHKKASERGLSHSSDDCGLVLALGEKIFFVDGEEKNFKITTAHDLKMAELLLFSQLTSKKLSM